MKPRLTQFIAAATLLGGWLFGFGGCSSTEVSPNAPPTFLPPTYIQVPHPAGMDMADLRSIFLNRLAPSLESLKDCDGDFRKLRSLTQSEDELRQGARELVRGDPVKYHWCFYGKVLELETDIKAESYVEERQKKILNTYQFLTPVARGFMTEYHDSRYYRWSIKHYRQLSQWIFYRKLELSPGATSELVDVTNPFGLWREPARPMPVLEKYNIVKAQLPDGPTANAPTLKGVQISGGTPIGTPSAAPSGLPEAGTAVSEASPLPATEPSGEPAAAPPPTAPVAAAPSPSPELTLPPPAEENRAPAAVPSDAPPPPAPMATEPVSAPPPPAAEEPMPSSSLVPAPPSSTSSEAVLNGDEVTPVEK